MNRLNKEQTRRRWAELRVLWNDYDPIGVMDDPNCPTDEYEAYVGPTMRLLEQDVGIEGIIKYLDWAVCERMGLTLNRPMAERFARRLDEWFRGKWAGSQV